MESRIYDEILVQKTKQIFVTLGKLLVYLTELVQINATRIKVLDCHSGIGTLKIEDSG